MASLGFTDEKEREKKVKVLIAALVKPAPCN